MKNLTSSHKQIFRNIHNFLAGMFIGATRERAVLDEAIKCLFCKIYFLNENIDIAFFPVDPRLKEYYYLGGEYFANILKPDLLIPMHFGDNYSVTINFYNKVSNIPVTVTQITRKGQEIQYIKEYTT